MMVGDVVLSVSCDLPEPRTVEATHPEQTAGVLRSAAGTVRLEVLRPKPAPPNRVLQSGFLHKRSPKGVIGVHAWQSRWFELSPTHLSYWELAIRSTGADDEPGTLVAFFLDRQAGSVALADVAGLREDRANLRRLDVLLKRGRMFQLAAPGADERAQWAAALQAAWVDTLAAPPSSSHAAAAAQTQRIASFFREQGSSEGVEGVAPPTAATHPAEDGDVDALRVGGDAEQSLRSEEAEIEEADDGGAGASEGLFAELDGAEEVPLVVESAEEEEEAATAASRMRTVSIA